MDLFRSFIKDRLALESIYYYDRTLFKNIIAGKYEPTKEQLAKIDVEQSIIKEDEERKYLQNDEEIKLIKTYQENPDSQEGRDAMTKLVENKMGLIYSKVNKFLVLHPNLSDQREDLVQEASLALMKAIENFDINSKNIFNAYAIKCISGAIQNLNNPVRQKSVVAGKTDERGNVTQMDSIDKVISGSRGEWADKDTTLGDSIPDEQATTPGEGTYDQEVGWISDADSKAEKKALLNDWMKRLADKEQTAIKLYFPEDGSKPKTYEEIGKEIGMTKMGAKKLIDRTLAKLKKFAAEEFKE